MRKGGLRGRRPLNRHDRNVVFGILVFVVITAILAGWGLSVATLYMVAFMGVVSAY
jgi:hypothetical protein